MGKPADTAAWRGRVLEPAGGKPDGDAVAHYRASRERAQEYAAEAVAANTRRAYGADWRDFVAWCDARGRGPLPASAETVAVYLADLAAFRKTSTVARRLAAISQAHSIAGFESPTVDVAVRQVMAGIRRRHGSRQQGKEPALTDDIRAMVARLDRTLAGRRDRALILLGFAGAFRRAELVALDVSDLTFGREGMVVRVSRGKTDQEGSGREAGIPYGSHPDTCPVRAVQGWLAVAGIARGALFRPVDRHGNLQPARLTAQSVALIVKRAAAAARLDPQQYAGHSLRSGLATSAAAAGVAERAIMDQTGHKSLPMVRRYIRRGSLFRENAAALVGL